MDPMIGKTIDNYRIIEVVGRGGMGIVFKAMDESLEKIVALKMIDPMLARDENFLRRFKREARALARLENANIVTVFALRETEQGVFMVMEFVEAKTVGDWIRENGAFEWRDAVKIGRQMVDALKHAHQVNVIHRDIKPSNIMLTSDGRVKITDFGLAKVVKQHGRDSTVTQATAGTLYYMSPEQVKGMKNVDYRSDLYSTGMTIYEMLVGQTPFEETDSDFGIQKKIVEGQIPPLSKFKSDVPKQLVKIIQRSMETDPNKRYQSAEEMLEALDELQASKVWEKDTGKKERSFSVPKPALISAAVIAALILVVVMLGGPSFFTGLFQGGGSADPPEGVISISSVPAGATVTIDGTPVGDTPISDYALETGSVSLQISKDGFATKDTSLQIAEGENIALNLSLETNQPVMSNQFTTTGGPGIVAVSSSPSGAEVWVNGNRMGSTPFRQELDEGSYQVRVTDDGYMDFARSVTVRESETVELSANLNPAGGLTINSTPSGAQVYLDNNRTRYTTPFRTSKIETGRKRVSLRMDGYQNFDTTLVIQQNNITAIAPRLSPATGQILVLVRPFGTIYIDGEVKARDTSAPYSEELPAGTHNVRVLHETFGRWDKTVNLAANETEEVLFNFNQTFTVTITSEPNYGEIYINGEATGEYTPKQLTLRPGQHTIDVRKDGFTLPEGPKTVTIEGDRTDQPLHFSLQQS